MRIIQRVNMSLMFKSEMNSPARFIL